MTLVCKTKLDFTVQTTNIRTQKINSLAFKMYQMITTKIFVHNK